jgi:CBS domain-containing protein
MLTVRDIMSQGVVRIRPEATVRELAHLLAQEQISGVPVVTDRDRLVGVVSATDIVLRAALHGSPADNVPWLEYRVEDIMTPAPLAVTPETTVTELARFLVKCRVHRALVTEGKRLVGVVTAFDIMRATGDDRLTSRAGPEEQV